MKINWRPRDEPLNRFADDYIESFAAWDLSLFFHYNPSTMDTAEGFAAKLGRPVEEVARALECFCERGCVSKSSEGGAALYCLDAPSELKETLARFVRAQEDRELRLSLIRSILQRSRE